MSVFNQLCASVSATFKLHFLSFCFPLYISRAIKVSFEEVHFSAFSSDKYQFQKDFRSLYMNEEIPLQNATISEKVPTYPEYDIRLKQSFIRTKS